MRPNDTSHSEQRSSALWGRGGRGVRASALWGRGGRGLTVLAALFALVIPTAGLADGGLDAAVPADLLAAAKANPNATFNVIVQGEKGRATQDVGNRVNGKGQLKRAFRSVNAVSATLTGEELLELADDSHIAVITRDAEVSLAGYESAEMWRASTKVARLYNGPATPAIAIVDSGVDASKLADFGSRVVARANFSSLSPGAVGDQLGHGTMVAGLAAGAGGVDGKYKGSAPASPIVDVRVTDGEGRALTSDIIAGIDWIIANKDAHNIRVANFSLGGTHESSVLFDPLNRAVESLWFRGIVVVTAAGNHGGTGPVAFSSPANDPFVITVGATDIRSSVDPSDDVRAPWSAYGRTADGFAKPELGAPGRYLIGPVPAASVFTARKPERVVGGLLGGGGYMWMSGTSFAAPIVSGAAAQILARRPEFGPDQVKGALMASAVALPSQGASLGVGSLDAAAAASISSPPNPNENLHAFVSDGSFDAPSWSQHVSTSSNWTVSNWTSSNWTTSNWTLSNWTLSNWTLSNWTLSNWTLSNWVD